MIEINKFKKFVNIAQKNVDKSRFTMKLYRFISKYISYIFVHIGITPNQITITHSLLELFGLLILASGNYNYYYYAIVLLVLGGILDNVDGEVARFTKNFSTAGYYLDYIFHRIIHPLFYLSLSIGIYQNINSITIIYFGVIASIGYIVSEISTNVYKHILFDKGVKADTMNDDTTNKINTRIIWWNFTIFCFDHMKVGLLLLTVFNKPELLIYFYTPLLVLRAIYAVFINYKKLKIIF